MHNRFRILFLTVPLAMALIPTVGVPLSAAAPTESPTFISSTTVSSITEGSKLLVTNGNQMITVPSTIDTVRVTKTAYDDSFTVAQRSTPLLFVFETITFDGKDGQPLITASYNNAEIIIATTQSSLWLSGGWGGMANDEKDGVQGPACLVGTNFRFRDEDGAQFLIEGGMGQYGGTGAEVIRSFLSGISLSSLSPSSKKTLQGALGRFSFDDRVIFLDRKSVV